MAPIPQLGDYRIAIICALGTESEAIENIFDEVYDTDSRPWHQAEGDYNTYTTGRIGRHYVVLAYLAGTGKVNAARCASNLHTTFSQIELALIVGVCGGAPYSSDGKKQIYLGDVIISTQIVQGDFGRENIDGFELKSVSEGNIGPPPAIIRSFLHKMQNQNISSAIAGKTKEYTALLMKCVATDIPATQTDHLFPPSYLHKHRSIHLTCPCNICQDNPNARCEPSQRLTCAQLGCESNELGRQRDRKVDCGPQILFGKVCSADTVKKNGISRDQFVNKYDVLGFEMEGAGVYENLPSIIVKSVCDYADSHKNKNWQAYAAVTASACCKTLLEEWSVSSTIVLSTTRSGKQETTEVDYKLRERYLASLSFSQLDSRLNNIKTAHPQTCEWVFNSTEFRAWLRPVGVDLHHRILWIRAKPGSGKSTLMKHIYDAKEKHYPGYTYAAYFFHARGSEPQRIRLGMLRSLLQQVFASNQKLLDSFIGIHERSGKTTPDREWTATELEDFLIRCVRDRSLQKTLLLIDALDECSLAEAREIAAFCEDLANAAVHNDTLLFIAVSIRYFPNIGLKKCIQLNLDIKLEHNIDIQHYITDKLRITDLEIEAQLLEKANHVFLWAVLVISNLNSAYDEGADNDSLCELLSNTPRELHKIFEQLLGPITEIPSKTMFLLQLVLSSAEPLNMRTLYLLIVARMTPEKICSWSESGMTSERLRSFVTTLSRGLLETIGTRHDYDLRTVQFIHESVRDYLRYRLKSQSDESLSLTEFSDQSHTQIARACFNITTTSGNHLLKQTQEDEDVKDWPHVEYARKYSLYHLNRISDTVKLAEVLREYARILTECPDTFSDPSRGLLGDTLLRSFILRRPRKYPIGHRSIISRREKYGGDHRLNQDDGRLLEVLLGDSQAMSLNSKKPERLLYEDALQTCIDKEWVRGVEILLRNGAEFKIDSIEDNCLQIVMRAIQNRGWYTAPFEEIAKLLVQAVIVAGGTIDNRESNNIVPLVVVCKYGFTELVSLLLKAGADPHLEDPNIGYALNIAILTQNVDVVRLLLSNKTDPNPLTKDDESPLGIAITKGNSELVQCLLEHGADPNGYIDRYDTFLTWAIGNLSLNKARLLLSYKAKPDLKTSSGLTAWDAARRCRNSNFREEILALLGDEQEYD